MAELVFIVAIIGNIIAILTFLTPVKTFIKVVKWKSTENFKGISYVTTLLSTTLWTLYGLLKPGGFLLATVNAAGALSQATYVTIFLIYAPKATRAKYLKLVGIFDICCPTAVIAILLLAFHGSLRLNILGFICAGLTLGMYASPLAAMRMVIKTKSVEYMPFTLSCFLFLNAGIWSAYAVLVKDFFVGVPNAIGFVMGSAQLVVYMVYYSKSSAESTKAIEKIEEDGSVHLAERDLEMGDYNSKSSAESTKAIEKIEEDGSVHLAERDLEMGDYKAQEKKERTLPKGRSLPKFSLSQQLSFQKLIKTYSLRPCELKTILPLEVEVK